MSARAVDTDEDTQVDAQPLRVRGTTISTLVITRKTANLENDALYAQDKNRQSLPIVLLINHYDHV